MPKWIPVSKSEHQTAGWARPPHFAHAAMDSAAPIVISEVVRLLPTTPIAFVQGGEHEYQLVAVQSMSPGLNLFVNPKTMAWMPGHIPALYRFYPFRLIPEKDSDRFVLCIDADYSGLHTPQQAGDEPFFDEQGEPTGLFGDINQVLRRYQNERTATEYAVQQLAEAGLIQPWKIQLKSGEQADAEVKPLEGLYRIDEKKLRHCPPETLAELNRIGALDIAYGQLMSIHRLPSLQRLYQLHNQLAPQTSQEVNLDAVFGEDDDSMFKF